MPEKLSETHSLYQPPETMPELEADLERFSDPTAYDQTDPMLEIRLAEIRRAMGIGSETDPLDQTRAVLESLLSSPEEVDEALSHGAQPPAMQ